LRAKQVRALEPRKGYATSVGREVTNSMDEQVSVDSISIVETRGIIQLSNNISRQAAFSGDLTGLLPHGSVPHVVRDDAGNPLSSG
jgi:hypothetical protein